MQADLQAVRAEIERQREIEAKATPTPWQYDGMHNEIQTPRGDDFWLIVSECRSAPDQQYNMDRFGHQYDSNFDLIATARNSHRALLDIAEAAAELKRPCDPRYHCQCETCKLFDRLDAALKRLVEGK